VESLLGRRFSCEEGGTAATTPLFVFDGATIP